MFWFANQSIVSVCHKYVYGYETLFRSDHGTLSTPATIFDTAERLGLVHETGRRARALAAAGVEAASNNQWWFVNLHPQDLLDETLYAPESPLSKVASRVVLEITERTPCSQIPDLRARLWLLRRLGFRIALDDLGAGYAGLTSFTDLEPEIVKIDMSLVRNIDQDLTKQTVIESIRRLCEQLGTPVIAEGVETAAEKDALLSLGCDLMQGYLFARPCRELPGVNW